MENKPSRTSVIEIIAITLLGVFGIVGYYNQSTWLFFGCGVLLCVLLGINIAYRLLQKNVYPLLIACLVVAYELSGSIVDTLLLGVSFYYAAVWLYALFLNVVPEIVMLLLVAIMGIVFFLFRIPVVAIPMGMFCLTAFVSAVIRGSANGVSYSVMLASIPLAVLLKNLLIIDGNGLFEASWVLSCSGSLFYPLTALYIFLYKAINGRYPNFKNSSGDE